MRGRTGFPLHLASGMPYLKRMPQRSRARCATHLQFIKSFKFQGKLGRLRMTDFESQVAAQLQATFGDLPKMSQIHK